MSDKETTELELVRPSDVRLDSVIGQLESALPMLQLLAPLFGALQHLAAANMASGPSVAGPAWKQVHDLCSLALGHALQGAAVPVTGRPAMAVPRFNAPPPPARNGAQPAWPGQGAQPGAVSSELSAVHSVPIGDIRKRDDVAREMQRLQSQLHPGAVPPPSSNESEPR